MCFVGVLLVYEAERELGDMRYSKDKLFLCALGTLRLLLLF